MEPDTLAAYEKLRKVRERTDLSLRPTKFLRGTVKGLDGVERPLALRYYQVQMVLHLQVMSRFVVGDDCGLGKTIESIAALCYLWERDPSVSAVVFTKKSAVRQWEDEFRKFTQGIQTVVCRGTPKQRAQAREEFRRLPGPKVLIMGHRSAVQDFGDLQDQQYGVLILDECTVVKNPSAQIHRVFQHLSTQSARVWGLTATLIKNNLVEGFGIYRVVYPPLFKHTPASFITDYCITQQVPLGRGRRVTRIVGYRVADVERFRLKIDPFYLGRPKHLVAADLPPLTPKTVKIGMTPEQHLRYQEALSGVLQVGEEEKEVSKLTAVTYCQEIVNHPALIQADGGSEKLDELVDMLTDGDLAGEKVIVFTRFEKMVGIGVKALEKAGVQCVRITGAEAKEDQRKAAQDTFQDPKSGVNVVWVTTAGSDAINLQAAKAIIFYDTPFSAGDYLQCLDAQTQVLTRRGFVGPDEINSEDEVAAFNPTTEEVSWRPIKSRVDRALGEGEQMWSLRSPFLDVRVTGGHRMLFQRQRAKGWGGPWRFETAEEMSREKTHYRLPVSGSEKAPGLPLTDDEIRLIGWFLTDGSLNRRNARLNIYQAAHQPQVEDIRRCLTGCGFDFKEYRRDRTGDKCFPNGKPIITFAIPKGGASGSRARRGWGPLKPYLDKNLSPLLDDLDRRQFAVLLGAIHLGDGTKFRTATWKRHTYNITTGNRLFAERLQSLAVRRGFRCNITTNPVRPPGKNITFIIRVKDTTFASAMGEPTASRPRMSCSPSVPGERVWCVENDVGTLVTRRDGKVTILGNCLGRMIRIGSLHDRVFAIHLVCEGTIDERVVEIMEKKMVLLEAVLGKRIKGDSVEEDEIIAEDEGSLSAVFAALRQDAMGVLSV